MMPLPQMKPDLRSRNLSRVAKNTCERAANAGGAAAVEVDVTLSSDNWIEASEDSGTGTLRYAMGAELWHASAPAWLS